MIAVDTNILVYSHRTDAHWHEIAKGLVRSLAQARGSWAIPSPCVHEFISICTNRKIFSPPTPLDVVFAQPGEWIDSGSLSLIHEGPNHFETLASLTKAADLKGPQVHDARIAAICLDHGVSELWTADRDFSRFPALRTRNPLIG